MKRNSILIGTLLLVTLGVPMLAQERQANTPPAEKPLSQATAYRVVVQLQEFEGEKRINTRSYDFIARPGEFTNFRNGLRIPVPGSKEDSTSGAAAGATPQFKSEGPRYEDVGLLMRAWLKEEDITRGEHRDTIWVKMPAGTVGFEFDIELTALATQEQVSAGGPPVLRVTSQRVNGIVPLDKPTVIATLDEVNSNRRMQVEATITKMKF